MPKRRHLTLVELLVILAILGILAAILLPAVQKAQQAASNAVSDTGVAERPQDPGARETVAALRGFAVGVAATLLVIHLLRRVRRRPRKPPEE